MFGEKTNDELVKYMVLGIAGGIALLVVGSFKINADIKMLNTEINTLKNTLNKSEEKINILVTYLQNTQNPKIKHLNSNDFLKLISSKDKSIKRNLITSLDNNNSTNCDLNTTERKNIINIAKKSLGKRLLAGREKTKDFINSSSFISSVYKKNGITIPRAALAQSKLGKYVSRSKLKKGDLIFFDTSKRRIGYVNHVGLYVGNGKFIHASSAKKGIVKMESLDNPFYNERYKMAKRVTKDYCATIQ